MTEPTAKIRILLTGAAGRIGRAFREYSGDRYALRLADRDLSRMGDARGHAIMAFDATDLAACQVACKDIDVVIHLAADPSPYADFYGSLLDNNIKTVYNIFRAAKDQGCQRVLYASSIRVMEGYPQGAPVPPDLPPRPTDLYGASKCFGEAVAHTFASSERLSSIVVRIGAFAPNWTKGNVSAADVSRFVSPRDLSDLLMRCVEIADLPFAIVHAVSNNRIKRLDISSTMQLLGYDPQDDGFRVFDVTPRLEIGDGNL